MLIVGSYQTVVGCRCHYKQTPERIGSRDSLSKSLLQKRLSFAKTRWRNLHSPCAIFDGDILDALINQVVVRTVANSVRIINSDDER